jgi:hypothetical protein
MSAEARWLSVAAPCSHLKASTEYPFEIKGIHKKNPGTEAETNVQDAPKNEPRFEPFGKLDRLDAV